MSIQKEAMWQWVWRIVTMLLIPACTTLSIFAIQQMRRADMAQVILERDAELQHYIKRTEFIEWEIRYSKLALEVNDGLNRRIQLSEITRQELREIRDQIAEGNRIMATIIAKVEPLVKEYERGRVTP